MKTVCITCRAVKEGKVWQKNKLPKALLKDDIEKIIVTFCTHCLPKQHIQTLLRTQLGNGFCEIILVPDSSQKKNNRQKKLLSIKPKYLEGKFIQRFLKSYGQFE